MVFVPETRLEAAAVAKIPLSRLATFHTHTDALAVQTTDGERIVVDYPARKPTKAAMDKAAGSKTRKKGAAA